MINEKLSFILNLVINKLNAISPAFIKRLSDLFWIKTARFQRNMKSTEISIRLYSLKDLYTLYSLFNQGNLINSDTTRYGVFNYLSHFCRLMFNKFHVFYVIEVKEKDVSRIIGFMGLYNIVIGQTVFLSIAIFKPDDRRQGYGKGAIELLLNNLKKNNIVKSIYVEVLTTNEPSLCFFKGLGFEICRQYNDRFLLEKNLENTQQKS